jgi:hypothetical protein
MRKIGIFVLLLCVIFLSSCKTNEREQTAKTFIAFQDGEKISYSDFQILERVMQDPTGRAYLIRDIKEEYGKNISDQEIVDLAFGNQNVKVILEKPVKNNQTTAPKGK